MILVQVLMVISLIKQCCGSLFTRSLSQHCFFLCSGLVRLCICFNIWFSLFPLTQFGFFSTSLFLQNVNTFFPKFLSLYHFKLSSIAHGIFKYTKKKIVTDLHDAEREKCQTKSFQRLDNLPEFSSKIGSWKLKTIP